ncbi:MAG: SUMF1/EgtB/PvdO family nonheme iron enzyme, partial [Pirellulaceae bacterium]|nr:SUMF1/EgtB/PvdO family nonheme iron enzyme [Pirellulaceae bacterium]
APHSLPETFGRYKIQKRLGAGAMGAVYLAKDTQLDRLVALKTPTFGGNKNEQMVERFYREARVAANLRNPNICPVYDVGEIDGRHYITMAFIEGRPLSDYVGQTLEQKAISVIVRKLALALADAHAQGVIHRDLKPANVMVDQKRQPLVMDFGLARRENELQSRMTQSGTIMGTPAYMSPEQVKGQIDEIGAQADIYSLGIMLYELLTGALPFEGSVAAVIGQILTEQARPPIELRHDVDPGLQAICLKMIAKEKSDRYLSMQAVAEDLGNYLKGTPVKRATESDAQPKPVVNEVAVPLAEAVAEYPVESAPVLDGIMDHLALPEMGTQAVAPAAAEKLRRHKKHSAGYFWKTANGRYAKWGLSILGVVISIYVVMLFFTGRSGTLTVASNDTEMVIQVDGKAVASGDDSELRLDNGLHELTLAIGKQKLPISKASPFYIVGRNGRYKLSVSLNEVPLAGADFSIAPGKKNSLSISLDAVKSTSSTTARVPRTPARKSAANNQSKTKGSSTTRNSSTSGLQSKFLAEVQHRNVKAEQGWFSTTGLATTLSVRRRKLLFKGVGGLDSIFMHPSSNSFSSVIFDLDRPYQTLKGAAAIPIISNERRQGDARTPLVFKVIGDGELLWQSRSLKTKDSLVPFEVNIKGVSTLQLQVECPGSNNWAIAAWYQPALFFGSTKDNRTQSGSKSSSVDSERRSMGTALKGAPDGLNDPFSTSDIARARQVWSRYLGLPEILKIGLPGSKGLEMEFVLIPPGKFLMGMPSSMKLMAGNKKNWANSSRPAHQVSISRPFYLSRYEVNRAQFEQVVGGGLVPQTKASAQLPAGQLSWDDANRFCKLVTEKNTALPTSAGLRLPTEAEWEYACRAGTSTRFWSGNQIFATDANLRLAGKTLTLEPVDSYLPNPFGLYNMHGNIAEWCLDRFSIDTYVSWTVRDPQGPPGGPTSTVRGGSFSSPPFTATSYWRRGSARGTKSANIGLRPVIQLDFGKFNEPTADANNEQAQATPDSDQRSSVAPWALGTWCYKSNDGKFEAEVVLRENGEVRWNDKTNDLQLEKFWEPLDATRILISNESGIRGRNGWHVVYVPGPTGVATCDDWGSGNGGAYASKWKSLINGNDLTGWVDQAMGKNPAKGWTVKNGILSGTGGGNAMTSQDFGDFELEFEWKVGTGGNSGVYYRDRPETSKKNGFGLEYAIYDDGNKRLPSQQCSGALWNLSSTYGNGGSLSIFRGANEWNRGIIQANGKRLTHWLNGVKSADITVGTTAWKQAIRKSKRSEPPAFGQQATGRIVLQQHTGTVSFRNMRIRPISEMIPPR